MRADDVIRDRDAGRCSACGGNVVEEGEQSLLGGGSIGRDVEPVPDAVDGGTAEAGGMRHHAPRPRTSSVGGWFERPSYDVADAFLRDSTRSTRARSIVKSSKSFLDEPSRPFACRARSDAKVFGNGLRVSTRGSSKHDGCS